MLIVCQKLFLQYNPLPINKLLYNSDQDQTIRLTTKTLIPFKFEGVA